VAEKEVERTIHASFFFLNHLVMTFGHGFSLYLNTLTFKTLQMFPILKFDEPPNCDGMLE
jgi:hypothetical protein